MWREDLKIPVFCPLTETFSLNCRSFFSLGGLLGEILVSESFTRWLFGAARGLMLKVFVSPLPESTKV